MFRHLKNVNELVLYGGFSCGLAFLARIEPAFFFPILILRISFLAYCLYVIGFVEQNRELGIILGAAVLAGWLGGYWDYFEILWSFNKSEIIGSFSIILAIIAFSFLFLFHWNHGKR